MDEQNRLDEQRVHVEELRVLLYEAEVSVNLYQRRLAFAEGELARMEFEAVLLDLDKEDAAIRNK